MNSLTDKIPVFPEIYVNEDGSVHTFLRKKHKGTWYIQCFIRHKSNAYKIILLDIYNFMIFGVPMKTITLPDGQIINQIDENQEDETDRLQRVYGLITSNHKKSKSF